MALRNIKKEGNPVLRTVCKNVPEVTDGIRRLIDDMFDTMYESNGVGLAAPQIGIVKRIIVVDDGDEGVFAMVNPVIESSSGEQLSDEGCLSLPGFAGKVKRPLKVKVRALDRNGEEFTVEAEGFLAVILSHEIDHLDGILFKDKAVEYGAAQ